MNNTFTKSLKFLIAVIFMMAMVFEFSSCVEDDDDPNPTDGDNIMLSNNSTHGNILVDADGMALYFFTMDVSGESNCGAGTCLTNWPVFHVDEISVGSGLDASDFGTITRDDGAQQTTYKGWPLYYYAADNDAGQTNGDGVGNVWYVAKPDYSIMLADAQLVGHDGNNYTSDYQEGDEVTQYLVDSEGRTLYSFINDYNGDNNFTASDFSNNSVWPVFYTDIDALPSALNDSDFGMIEVFGEQQLTYKGWPLYYFGQDANRGENKGISFPAPGVWPIVNTNTETAPPAPPTVMMGEDETFGNILTDGDGVSLYYFSNDADGTSHCSGGCLDSWPKFYTDEIRLPESSNLNPDDFGTVGEGDDQQTTYKGWPLYYYAPEGDGVIEEAGGTAGDGVFDVWYIAKPDYSLMIANAQLVGNDGVNYTSDYEEGEGMTRFFTDAEGRTLYIYSNDTKDTNNYTAEDFSNNDAWPIFHVSIDQLPSGMTAADFGEIDVFGESQLTFKGWPLYYFGQDENRGETKGVSVPSPGVWPIANNDTEMAPE